MLKENVFRKFMLILTIVTIIIVLLTTYRYYKNLPELKEDIKGKSNNLVLDNKDMPLEPFEALSSNKSELMIKIGQGKEGLADSYENMYIDYKQKWFSYDVDTRYFYGDYDRVYQIILSFPYNKAEDVYKKIKEEIGEPLYDGIYESQEETEEEQRERVTYWLKDSVRYTMANYEEDDLCMVTMNLQYYPNIEGYDMGKRPAEIQRINSVKLGNSTEEGNIILIGDKPEYTSTFYERLFVIFGSAEKTYMGTFDEEYDGGFYPDMKVVDTDKDGENELVVQAHNEYTTFYTVFDFDNGKFTVVYSGEVNPVGKDIEKLEREKPDEIVINEEKQVQEEITDENSEEITQQ